MEYTNCLKFNERLYYNGIEEIARMFMDDMYSSNERKLEDKFISFCVVLSNLYESQRTNKMVAYSRDYHKYNFGQVYITAKITLPQIDWLIDNGFIHNEAGFYDRKTKGGRMSRMHPVLFNEYMEKHYLTDMFFGLGTRTVLDYSRLLELRGKSKPDAKKYTIILPFELTEEIEIMQANLLKYNSYISTQIIEHIYTNNAYNNTTNNVTHNLRNYLDGKCQRVFNSNFLQGGRHYCGEYQMMAEKERKNIQINGQNTVELDYDSLHPNMLYHLKDIDFKGDLYFSMYDNIELKRLIKLLFFTVINAKDIRSAKRAFNYEVYYRDPYKENSKQLRQKLESNDLTFDIMFDRLLKVHHRIKDKFCSGEGIRLQNIDSRITAGLLNKLTDAGIPTLNIHDSYIVPENHSEALYGAMRDEYELNMNNSIGVK